MPAMPPQPTVFIGIPTFNRPEMVRDAIASVLAQGFGSFRLVVSDNRSDGGATDAVRRHVADLGDPRVTFVVQPENRGEYGQGRFFMAQAGQDDLFMILHDDDVLHADYLADGVAALAAYAEADFFVANAYAMTPDGVRSAELTAQHLRDQGRVGAAKGLYDVLEGHLACGFAPISGTLFRRGALERSGFVDADCHGNYPFEANVFLRLGEAGGKAWFSPAERMGVRFHPGALRSQRLLQDPALVATCIRIWGRRRFTGALERRRRVLLACYYRAQALIEARQGRVPAARRALAQALRNNPASPRAWALAPVMALAPGVLRMPASHARRPGAPHPGTA